MKLDSSELTQFFAMPLHALAEAILAHSLLRDPFQIQLCDYEYAFVANLSDSHQLRSRKPLHVPSQARSVSDSPVPAAV